jgi:hypothetical protein
MRIGSLAERRGRGRLGPSMLAATLVVAGIGLAYFVLTAGGEANKSLAVGTGESSPTGAADATTASDWVTDEVIDPADLSPEEAQDLLDRQAEAEEAEGSVPREEPAGEATLDYVAAIENNLAGLGIDEAPADAVDEVTDAGPVNSRLLAWQLADGSSLQLVINYLQQPLPLEAIGDPAEVERRTLDDGTIVVTHRSGGGVQALRVFPDGAVLNAVTYFNDSEVLTIEDVVGFVSGLPAPPAAE